MTGKYCIPLMLNLLKLHYPLGKISEQTSQIMRLDRLNRLAADDLRWHEGQEVMWKASDLRHQDLLNQSYAENLRVLPVYSELDQQKDRNTSLREGNSWLRLKVGMLEVDAHVRLNDIARQH